MKVSEILKVVGDCERLRGILLRGEELMEEDKTNICDFVSQVTRETHRL